MIQNETTALVRKPNPVVAIWRSALLQAFLSDTITLLSASFLLIMIVAAVFANWVAPYNPKDQQLELRLQAPLPAAPRQTAPSLPRLQMADFSYWAPTTWGETT